MIKILKIGKYKTMSGTIFELTEDLEALCESNGEIIFNIIDEDGNEFIVPMSRILTEDGESYSTSHSTSADSSHEGTDTTGGKAKVIKKRKKKIILRRSTRK